MRIVKAIIRSNLGGNLRVRGYDRLQDQNGNEFKVATTENVNPFYQVPQIKKPVISITDPEELVLKPTFLYDIATNVGQEVMLLAK